MTRIASIDGNVVPLPVAPSDMAVPLAARAYQTEMYEKCVKENIIVVLPTLITTLDRTRSAALRIKHELSIADSTKVSPGRAIRRGVTRGTRIDVKVVQRIWFLTPTVVLCHQQCKTLQSQIRSVEIRSLTSHDHVEGWRSQQLWDSALRNVRIAVATYGVLQNALSDGFVAMSSISLIVFDEAHRCVGKSAGSKIMHDFYWPAKDASQPVPRILGMTASPVNKTGGGKLAKLEKTLDARCRSPQLHRESLHAHVNRPAVVAEYYRPRPGEGGVRRRSITSAREILARLDWEGVPQVVRYRTENTESGLARLAKAQATGRGIMVVDQLRTFCERAEAMADTLGMLGAEVYMAKVVGLFIGQRPLAGGSGSGQVDQTLFQTWDFSSRVHLAGLLKGVEVDDDALNTTPTPGTGLLSTKIDCLVRVLDRYFREPKATSSGDRCIVFVTERATAVILHHLLSRHPVISPRFRAGCVVGSSRHERGRRDLGAVHSPADQSDVIEKFRAGEVNLMVATAVAEEGLDVSACNLVVCFDPPMSPNSFIQRRGRARRAGSGYVLLVDETKAQEQKDWEEMEAQLRAEYEREDDGAARRGEAGEREKTSHRKFVQPETGAVLDMENAKGRLQRFCAAAGKAMGRHVGEADRQPYYIFKEVQAPVATDSPEPWMKAKVVLPACVSYRLRTTWSKGAWQSERNASKDAAFQAFMRLYEAGLVNNNLLPLAGGGDSDSLGEDMCSLIEIREQFNPWIMISKAWEQNGPKAGQETYTVMAARDGGDSNLDFEMKLPAADLEGVAPFRVALEDAVWQIRIETKAPSPTECVPKFHLIVQDTQRQQPLAVFKASTNFSPLKELLPHILYKIEAQLVAQELQRRIFFNIPSPSCSSCSLIRSGITTPARGEAEYENLEFVGDAALKFLASVFLTAKYPLWPVGYLSPERARLVSSANLCRAALERGIDRFLLTKPFAVDFYPTSAADAGDKRETARRTVAHTVKALIGAGKQAGEYGAALSWAKALLPGSLDLPSVEVGRLQLFDFASSSAIPLSADLAMVEKLAGYSFRKRSLLTEALTHGSQLPSWDEQTDGQYEHGCYDRLSFLGNAILETIVSDAIHSLARHRQGDAAATNVNWLATMSLCRAAVVNRHYLGYLALSRHVSQNRMAVRQSQSARGGFIQERYAVEFSLSRFLRHSSNEVAAEMAAAEQRFTALRVDIGQAIASGKEYPWLLMTRLQANGFHADMIESLVGAIFIDSGSVGECEGFLERIGLLPYLRRMIEDEIDLVHPRERLNGLAGARGESLRYHVTREEGLRCDVFMGENLVAQVVNGVGNEDIQVEAAVEAIAKLSL
ncbi:hypothetical protein OQA88_7190 [Cercophora sp. LCS_1]